MPLKDAQGLMMIKCCEATHPPHNTDTDPYFFIKFIERRGLAINSTISRHVHLIGSVIYLLN